MNILPQNEACVTRKALSFCLPSAEFLAALCAADTVYVAAAVTSPSISVRTEAMSAWSASGDGEHTVAEYKNLHGCGVNATSRLRALTLLLPCSTEAFIDLDQLAADERAELVRQVFARPVVCAESAPLMGYVVGLVPDLDPALVLDLSIVVRVLYPELPYELNRRAAAGDERARAELARRGHHPCSLSAIVAALGLPETPETYSWPDGRGWTLGALSSSHQRVMSYRALQLLEVLEAITGTSTTAGDLEALRARDTGGEFFGVFERAPIELARIHVRGLGVYRDALHAIDQDASDRIGSLVMDLIDTVPELRAHIETLQAESSHGGDEVRRILGGYAARCGHPLPCDGRGVPKIGAETLALSGASDLPGFMAWSCLEAAKRAIAASAALRTHSRTTSGGDRRVHPMLSVQAVTGRLGCSAPNAQGMDSAAKSAVVAQEGHTLIEADFGAIEIRIAAAQAVQVLREAEDVINNQRTAPDWVRRSLIRGRDEAGIQKPGKKAAPWEQLAYWYSRVQAIGTPLVDLLAAGLCPHDYTGLGIVDRSGGVTRPAGMTRSEYMQAQGRKTIRAMVSARRPAAKVANFGLLYLMGDRGLWEKGILDGVSWTQAEAAEVRSAWFEDFPEIAFANEFVLAVHRDAEPITMSIKNRYGAGMGTKPIRLYRSKTIGGRALVTHDDRVINARAQGTGATMCLKAIVDAPSYLKDVIVMPVHDSILIDASADRADWYADELAQCMARAAAAYLEPYGVPAVVETKRGKTWGALA